MKNRYSFGGDEHLFVEVDEEMSLAAFFKALSMTETLKSMSLDGVVEICPANASFQIKFNPDVISPDEILAVMKDIEKAASEDEKAIDTRIIEVPVFYQDPWTQETLMRFRERHQTPDKTDLEFAAQINGYDSVDAFIDAHCGSPWFVTMVGFVSGLPFMYQMVEREKQIQVPKYLRPRTDTPKHTVGYGGCFSCIYSVRGAGGYQMFGVTPLTIFDPSQKISYLNDFMVFFKPGDIIKYVPVDHAEFDRITAAIEDGTYQPNIHSVCFSLDEFEADMPAYNRSLLEVCHGG
ncbi:5-oxoprolinase subunit B family protein [Enterovibrio norvegicus]|uniref:5-oxoprolinase subunit B family protein n=1 Tax=Enterovibrio norvegicus TaxID=188144 RepID=UPI000C819C78|nr:allophanate hydrolase subunit 1 [Enterovibrio norvegicus]PML81927.1 allophanate hydrolase [Enterovibrio norvegicus]